MAAPRILLIHLFSNGDCLYATTVAKQIKADHPNCQLTWAIARNCRSMILNNPDVDEVWEIDMPPGEDKDKIFSDILQEAANKKNQGVFDEVFCSQVLGDNWVHYDSCVRTSIYRCYGRPITVSKRPVLILTQQEKDRALAFARENNLTSYNNVILYECAPLSGQAKMTDEFVTSLAGSLTDIPRTAVVLSSAKKFSINKSGVIDGSGLSIRETVALAYHCNLLLGCSSGITWAVHSQQELTLPSVQLLDRKAFIYNPPSIAMNRAGEDHGHVLELFSFSVNLVSAVVKSALTEGFLVSRKKFDQPARKQFRVFRGIVHRFVHNKQWRLLARFARMNLREHGLHPAMLFKIAQGFLLYPIQSRLNRNA